MSKKRAPIEEDDFEEIFPEQEPSEKDSNEPNELNDPNEPANRTSEENRTKPEDLSLGEFVALNSAVGGNSEGQEDGNGASMKSVPTPKSGVGTESVTPRVGPESATMGVRTDLGTKSATSRIGPEFTAEPLNGDSNESTEPSHATGSEMKILAGEPEETAPSSVTTPPIEEALVIQARSPTKVLIVAAPMERPESIELNTPNVTISTPHLVNAEEWAEIRAITRQICEEMNGAGGLHSDRVDSAENNNDDNKGDNEPTTTNDNKSRTTNDDDNDNKSGTTNNDNKSGTTNNDNKSGTTEDNRPKQTNDHRDDNTPKATNDNSDDNKPNTTNGTTEGGRTPNEGLGNGTGPNGTNLARSVDSTTGKQQKQQQSDSTTDTEAQQRQQQGQQQQFDNANKLITAKEAVGPTSSNKYGGMYVEPEALNDGESAETVRRLKECAAADEDGEDSGSDAPVRRKAAGDGLADDDIEILGVMLERLKSEKDRRQAGAKRQLHVEDVDETAGGPAGFTDPDEAAQAAFKHQGDGQLEGMCPVTGNYLRDYNPPPPGAAPAEGQDGRKSSSSNKLQRLNQLIKEARGLKESLASDRNNKALSDVVSTRSCSACRDDSANTATTAVSSVENVSGGRFAGMEEGVLDPSQLTTTSAKSGKLSRGWSTRMIRTLSNRYRQEDSDSEEENGENCIFGNQIRFTIMIISTLCLSSILSNILTFNFTFICMAGPRPHNFSAMTEEEIRQSGYRPDLDYDSTHRSALFMAVAVGALLAVFPMTVLLNKFGSRTVFGILGFISALSTYLIPVSANAGFGWILIMRVIQGVGFSACLPVMGSITSHWSTLKQNGIFIAILSSFLQIAPIFTMPISGELCMSEYGWESVYYLHGTVCIVLFAIFICYHRNSPHKHPLILRKELVKVMFGKGSIYSGPGRQKKSKKVPYRALYSDPAIWAIFIAAFGNFMGTQLSLQFMPTYINKVLFLPISQTGMASAISPIIMFFIKLVAGQSSDKITFISDIWKLRIYNSLSIGLMGVFFIVLALMNPVEQKSMCLIVLILSTCILGFNSGGFFKSSQMVSRQHSHFTLANISFLNCVCMLIVPLLNELIAPENTPETWAIVLWIHGIILLVTNAIFCVMCSARPAPWTLDTWKNAGAEERARRKRSSRVAPQRQSEIRRTNPAN